MRIMKMIKKTMKKMIFMRKTINKDNNSNIANKITIKIIKIKKLKKKKTNKILNRYIFSNNS